MTSSKANSKSEGDVKVIRLEFEDAKPPTTTLNKTKDYVSYGAKNDYPIYLLDMFDKSGKHSAIVKGKADFIMGNGFAFNEDQGKNSPGQTFLNKCNNEGETLEDVFSKVTLDVEIFGGGYVEVLYNKKGKISEVYHVDFTTMRPNEKLTSFSYSENWLITNADGTVYENTRPTIEQIPAFDSNSPRGKQILYIREYRPNSTVYPTPSYFAALRYILIDMKIGEYHLNGISNGMFASKMINFNNGVPEPDAQKAIEKKVNEKFAGAKNAGKIMLSFSKSGDNAPTVLDLSGTELDKHFDILNKTTETQIFSSHRVTSPALFGIKSEGLFSNNQELRQAFELIQNTYCDKKRKFIEKNVNAILNVNGLPNIYLQRGEPVGIQFSEQTIAGVLTENEIRETIGKKPKEQETQTAPATKPPETTPAKFADLDDDKDILVFNDFGQKKSDYEILESRPGNYENDFQFHSHYFATVKDLTKNQKKIIDLISKDAKIPVESIAKALKISKDAVSGILKGLERDGLIKVDTRSNGEDVETIRSPSVGAKDVIDNGDGETTSIKVMYSYEGVRDSKNREFCAKLLDLDKLYTRQDIEAISAQLGYSVWHRRGGWYRPKGASEARPYCRHNWQTNTVINKTAN